MIAQSEKKLLKEIRELKERLAESEQLIEAVKAGEVDAFAIYKEGQSEIYTLQSGDYAYRVLVEEFGEGALNVTEEGVIVYANRSFCELAGLSCEKITGSFFQDLIHPDSSRYYEQMFLDSLQEKSKGNGKSKGEINLAIGARLVPVSISLTSLRPKLATVGIVISDLTEKKQNEQVILNYQKDLEAKNQALTQSNAELASFAFVASHDLQEPLRKIQIFSDRILEKESGQLSTSGRDYFRRIKEASRRMQELIRALLNYSRITGSEMAQLPTDLNQLVAEVRASLRELIEETNGAVSYSGLPCLRIVPHQFMQLFSNIIINSIKYRKPGVPPRIDISAKRRPAAGLGLPPALGDSQYWEIRVSDNGIGFEQQHARRVFELFQRLHGRFEYEGTGIGLAICNKIVQHHGGYITAEGNPGTGATFIIYLPLGEER